MLWMSDFCDGDGAKRVGPNLFGGNITTGILDQVGCMYKWVKGSLPIDGSKSVI